MGGEAIPTTSVADLGFFIPETIFFHPQSRNQQQKRGGKNTSILTFK
jgi:hypothetical protein